MDTWSAAYKNTKSSWEHMLRRCRGTNPKYIGIKVCERWGDFDFFLRDMGLRPSLAHSIDRFPNPAGNYEPTNCRWATSKEQCRNKRINVYIEYEGVCRLLVDVIEELGLNYPVIYGRLKMGWALEKALKKPVRNKRKNRKQRKRSNICLPELKFRRRIAETS
jgi:hypothetical protein